MRPHFPSRVISQNLALLTERLCHRVRGKASVAYTVKRSGAGAGSLQSLFTHQITPQRAEFRIFFHHKGGGNGRLASVQLPTSSVGLPLFAVSHWAVTRSASTSMHATPQAGLATRGVFQVY